MGPSNVPGFIPSVWSKELIFARDSNLVVKEMVNTSYEGEIKEYGDTVRIPNVSQFAAHDVPLDGSDVTFNSVNEEETILLINRQKSAAFRVPKKTIAQSQIDSIKIYTAQAGKALAREIQKAVLAEYSNFTTTPVWGATLTKTLLTSAMLVLENADVPEDEMALVVNPVGNNDIRNIEGYVSYQQTGMSGGDRKTRAVAEVHGVPVFKTTDVEIAAKSATASALGSTATTHKYMLVHKTAISLAMQKELTVEAQNMARNLHTEVVPWNLYGIKTVRPDHGILIERDVDA